MSTETKKRILYPALLAVALWPIVQMGLVAKYDISAWRLGGWGMYSQPHVIPNMRVDVRDETGWHPVDRTAATPWIREAAAVRDRRKSLGSLATPDALADQILATAPDVEALEIVFISTVLNPRTGMLEERRDPYRYERPSSAPPALSNP